MKVLYNDGHVAECPAEEEVHVLRHSAAHIMAQAIKRLYPQADFGYGPATDNGFFYDVDFGEQSFRGRFPGHRGGDEEDLQGEPEVHRL